jgi:beta-lactam-binding protein with PASTA domain
MGAAILAPVLAVSGAGVAYASWDSTRVVVPELVGQPLADGMELLKASDLRAADVELPSQALDANCYLISHQSVGAGTRVVSEETTIDIEIEPTRRTVPDVTGMTLGEATRALRASCLEAGQARLWCVPDGFSGGTEALRSTTLALDTGFTFDPFITRLRHDSLEPDGSWIVCDQLTVASKREDAASAVGLVLTAPLTTVPSPAEAVLSSVVAALKVTADRCALVPDLLMTFPEDPDALRGAGQPPSEQMAGWAVASLAPKSGQTVLCNESVRIEVIWPRTTMPQLVGLFHSPETPQATTATTSALLSAQLTATCSGRGTVTSQSPAAGEPVPMGTSVTCLADLVMPSIVGMDPASAQATLKAAGVTGVSSGSGVVVSQSPAAGTSLSGLESVSFHAEVPQPLPVYGGGGSAYYKNCDAARAAGAAPIYRGEAGYRPALDRDKDGIACE